MIFGRRILDFTFVENFVDRVARDYGTRDVFAIAEKAKVPIIYESWHPVTYGEFERKTKTISVNLRALAAIENASDFERTIVAHELAHFFARDWRLEREAEENFARRFAEIGRAHV